MWLDPERDLIVRRKETVEDDGTITVWQHDDVIPDSNGVWFAKRWRSGRVLKRGDTLPEMTEPDDNNSGVSTSVHIAEIKFK